MDPYRKKYLLLDELKNIVSVHKTEGKRIVFTNGCFDILHIGHVRYLNEAKKLGDILIVAINSDCSTKRLKPKRPIIPEDQRAEMLASIEMVDYITVFYDDTPINVIKELKPDVLVKGGDWQKEDILGNEIVPEVYSLPYIKGISTTEIIKRIISLYKCNDSDTKEV